MNLSLKFWFSTPGPSFFQRLFAFKYPLEKQLFFRKIPSCGCETIPIHDKLQFYAAAPRVWSGCWWFRINPHPTPNWAHPVSGVVRCEFWSWRTFLASEDKDGLGFRSCWWELLDSGSKSLKWSKNKEFCSPTEHKATCSERERYFYLTHPKLGEINPTPCG